LVFVVAPELVVFFALGLFAQALQVVLQVVSCSLFFSWLDADLHPHLHFILFSKKEKPFLESNHKCLIVN
jgi:hypothetical protein